MTHELKILPEYWHAVYKGEKRFEIRKNDRDYKVGDTLILRSWENGQYTGHQTSVKVLYILYGTKETEKFGLKDGYCIMSIL